MSPTRLPSAGFSITIRVSVVADASAIGRLTTCVGEAGAIVTALDVVDSDPVNVTVDLTCDTADSGHADQVVKTLEDRGWIETIGYRETAGRPALYATTRHFLDDLGLASLDQLPTIASGDLPLPALNDAALSQPSLLDAAEAETASPLAELPADTSPAPDPAQPLDSHRANA